MIFRKSGSQHSHTQLYIAPRSSRACWSLSDATTDNLRSSVGYGGQCILLGAGRQCLSLSTRSTLQQPDGHGERGYKRWRMCEIFSVCCLEWRKRKVGDEGRALLMNRARAARLRDFCGDCTFCKPRLQILLSEHGDANLSRPWEPNWCYDHTLRLEIQSDRVNDNLSAVSRIPKLSLIMS